MIVAPRLGLLDILFRIQGSVVPRIAGRLLAVSLLSVAAVLFTRTHPAALAQLGAMPFTLLGLALSIFMSFRTNACYDRWWEGRKLWGQHIILARAFARQVAHLDPAERAPLLLGLVGVTHGLAARLRGRDEAAAIAPWVTLSRHPAPPNPTDAALTQVGLACTALAAAGRIGPMHHAVLETQLTGIGTVQGGCERIQSTPLPLAFSLLLHRTAYCFCLLLPFALAGSMGWWTPLPVLVVCYTFFGLDTLADELENPFGNDPNDLPLDAIVRTVERDLLAAAGHTDLPPPLQPVRGVLM